MPVDGADVLEAAALEKVVFVQPALDAVLDFAQVPAEGARILECALHARIEAAVPLFRRDFGDGAVERGVVGADGHAVVVEHHEEVFRLFLGGKHRLERQTVAERRVADEADDAVAFAAQIARVAQTDARRDGVAAVTGDEGVVFALEGVGEPAYAPCARRFSSVLPVRSLWTYA